MKEVSKIDLMGEELLIKDETGRQSIEELKTETNNKIREVNEKINKIGNKKYLFIGDSYMAGYTNEGMIESFARKVINRCGLDATVLAIGGEGFAHYGPNGNFETRLNSYTGDKSAITDIYVIGGYNDMGHSTNEIIDGIANFLANVKTNYVNAKVTIGFIGWSIFPSDYTKLQRALRAYSNCSISYPFAFINNLEYALHYSAFFSSDKIHPNANGQLAISKYLQSYIMGGTVDVVYESKTAEIEISNGYSFNGMLFTSLNNNICEVNHTSCATLRCNITQNDYNGFKENRHQFGLIKQGHLFGLNNTGNVLTAVSLSSATVPTIAKIGGTWVNVSLIIDIINGGLFINVLGTNGRGYASGNLTDIVIPPFKIIADSSIN